jgi:hypothetical protein
VGGGRHEAAVFGKRDDGQQFLGTQIRDVESGHIGYANSAIILVNSRVGPFLLQTISLAAGIERTAGAGHHFVFDPVGE